MIVFLAITAIVRAIGQDYRLARELVIVARFVFVS